MVDPSHLRRRHCRFRHLSVAKYFTPEFDIEDALI